MLIGHGINHQWSRPHAQRYGGRTYYAYQGSASSNAHVCVRYYDHTTEGFSDEVILATYPGGDTHGAPSIIIPKIGAWAGHVFVFYGYNAQAGYVRRATNPEDITSFGAAVSFETSMTYTNPIQVANGDLWVFYRWADPAYPDTNWPNRPLVYRVSSDGGATWSARTVVVTPKDTLPSGFCYAIVRNVGDTIHVAWMSYDGAVALGNYGKGPFHIYTTDKGATWRKSDGTALTLPIHNSDVGPIYAMTSTQECYLTDLRLDGDIPHVQWRVYEQGAAGSGRFHAHYDGGWIQDTADLGVTGINTLDPDNAAVAAYPYSSGEYPLVNTLTGETVGAIDLTGIPTGSVWWVDDDPDHAVTIGRATYPIPGDYSVWNGSQDRVLAVYDAYHLDLTLGVAEDVYHLDVTLGVIEDVYQLDLTLGVNRKTRRRQRIALGGV